jgi:hypothetical protein
VLFGATSLTALAIPLILGNATASAAPGDPVVTQQAGTNGCNGVRPTPGSENTNKRLIGGSLVPGGTATFEISYPVDPSDVSGRTTFVITDCVFINGHAVTKYTVSFVPNTENFVLTYTLNIPSGADLGGLFCNYAKTTAAPSTSQASNRKAGPACFRIGGDIRVVKVAADTEQTLTGASFAVSCDPPGDVPSVPPVVISGLAGSTATVSGSAYVASGVASTGAIAIAGPIGTVCTVTETAPPAGYALADPATQTVTVGAEQVTATFEDPPVASRTTIATVATSATLGSAISDTATLTGATAGATGTITFSLYNTADCSNDPVFTDDAAVHGNGKYTSGTFTPTAAGSYYWVAAYSGDDANLASTGSCGDTGERSVVTAPAPSSTVITDGPGFTSPAPQGGSQQPLANTGTSHVGNEVAWALALLMLGAALTTTGIRRYQRKH